MSLAFSALTLRSSLLSVVATGILLHAGCWHLSVRVSSPHSPRLVLHVVACAPGSRREMSLQALLKFEGSAIT